jgi:hypothetical protein
MKKKLKFSKATVHESCNTVVEKIVKISLLIVKILELGIGINLTL